MSSHGRCGGSDHASSNDHKWSLQGRDSMPFRLRKSDVSCPTNERHCVTCGCSDLKSSRAAEQNPRKAPGQTIAPASSMRLIIPRCWKAALLGAALIAPVIIAPTALCTEDHKTTYHDRGHNDDHEWNNHEDRAYRVWTKENHRRYHNFSHLKDNDREAYWGWRHEHSDSLLKIDIR